MNKKIVLAITLFIVLMIAVPLLLTLFFSQQTSSGKIVVNSAIDAPYLDHTQKEYTLVFFGYVGCEKICTPILDQLNDFYKSKEFSPIKPYTGVSFVNLMPELTPEQPQIFARSFNPDFEGVYLTQKQLMGVDRSFSLFFSKSLMEAGEINHSDHLYLIYHKQGSEIILKNIYSTHPMNRHQIINDISRYLNEDHQ